MKRISAPGRAAVVLAALSVLALLTHASPLSWSGLAILLVFAVLRWRRLGRPIPPSPFTLPLTLYLLGAAIGLFVTVRPATAEIRLFGLLAGIGAFSLVLEQARTPAAARRILLAALVLTLMAAPLVLILIAPSLRVDRLPGPASLLGGLVISLVTPFDGIRAAVLGSDDFGQRYRLSSAGLGVLAAYGLGLALGPLIAAPTRQLRLLGALAGLIFAILLILPFNRTAILITALVPAALLAMRYRWVLGALLVAVTFAVVAGVMLVARARSGQFEVLRFLPDAAADLGPLFERLEYWQNYWAIVMDFRLTGVGLGLRSAADLYEKRYLPIDPGFNHAHNMFLQSYLEQGLLGLLGLLWLTLLALRVGSQALRKARDASTRMVAISGSAAGLVLLLEGLTEVVPLTSVGMVLLLGAVGLMLAAERLATSPSVEQPDRPVSAPARRLATPAAVAAFIPLLLVGTSLPGLAQTAQSTSQENETAGPVRALMAQVTLNLGSIELMQGTFDENRRGNRREHQLNAERLLRQSLELDPSNLSAYRGLADLAVARNQAGEVRRLLSEARRRASTDDSRFNFQLGRLYKVTGSVDLAIAAWTRVDRDLGAWSCSSPDVQLVRWGLELAAQERYESAEKAYRAAIKVRPTDPLPYGLLAGAMLASEETRRDLRTAREKIQKLTREEYPDVPWGYREVTRFYHPVEEAEQITNWTEWALGVENSPEWAAFKRRHERVRSCDAFLSA